MTLFPEKEAGGGGGGAENRKWLWTKFCFTLLSQQNLIALPFWAGLCGVLWRDLSDLLDGNIGSLTQSLMI